MIALQKSAQNQLRQFIEQLERLEEEKRSIQVDIKEKFQEAKALGFDVKAMRRILQLRRKSKADREEEEAILQTYMHALGMLEDTPLGQWALEQKKTPAPTPRRTEPTPIRRMSRSRKMAGGGKGMSTARWLRWLRHELPLRQHRHHPGVRPG